MSKLIHCRLRTTILLIIQISMLIGGVTLGIIGSITHNDLVKECMSFMPMFVCLPASFVCLSEKDNFKMRRGSDRKQNAFWLVLGLALSLSLLGFILCLVLLFF